MQTRQCGGVLAALMLCGAAVAADGAAGGTPLGELPSSCYCNNPRTSNITAPQRIRTDVNAGLWTTLHCCAQELLPGEVVGTSNVTVTWTYNNQSFPWTILDSQFGDRGCYPQELTATSVYPSDRGEYTCTYHLPGGMGNFSRTYVLKIHGSAVSPMIAAVSNDTLARRGEQVLLYCKAYTGNAHPNIGPKSVIWWAYGDDGTAVPAEEVQGVVVRWSNETDDGMYTSSMHIAWVRSIHYRVYACQAVNAHGTATHNVTLRYGVPTTVARLETYKSVVVVVVVCAVVFSLVVSLAYRHRLALALLFRSGGSDRADQYDSDVFIIHGPSSTAWVLQVLLPWLEGGGEKRGGGYICYLPLRDLQGGEALVDALPYALRHSRRAVVVVTSCLLDSPWALYCMEQAVHVALCNTLCVVAVLMQDIARVETTPQSERLLSRLSVIKKIQHPSYLSTKIRHRKNTNKMDAAEEVEPHGKKGDEDERHQECSDRDPANLEDFDNAKRLDMPQIRCTNSSVHCLGNNTTVITNADKCFKAKSDLHLNLTVTDTNYLGKSNSLQNQRVMNMISSTHTLEEKSEVLVPMRSNGSCLVPNYILSSANQKSSATETLKRNPYFFGNDINQNTNDEEVSFDDIKRYSNFFRDQDKLNLEVPAVQSISSQRPLYEVSDKRYLREFVCTEGNRQGMDDGHKRSYYADSVEPYKVRNIGCHLKEESIEPDSPCSVTPFILPLKEAEDIQDIRAKRTTVGGALCSFLTEVFIMTPERQFWQRLLLELPAVPLHQLRQRQLKQLQLQLQ